MDEQEKKKYEMYNAILAEWQNKLEETEELLANDESLIHALRAFMLEYQRYLSGLIKYFNENNQVEMGDKLRGLLFRESNMALSVAQLENLMEQEYDVGRAKAQFITLKAKIKRAISLFEKELRPYYSHIDELEHRVKELETENHLVAQRNENLVKDIKALKADVESSESSLSTKPEDSSNVEWEKISSVLRKKIKRNKTRKDNIISIAEIVFIEGKPIETGEINKTAKLHSKVVRACLEDLEKLDCIALTKRNKPLPWVACWNCDLDKLKKYP